jgi:putative ABC transport system permease protein
MALAADHIDFIIKDLHYRGVVYEPLRDELIDHICTATEERMQRGQRFSDAYHDVLLSFGHTAGLRQTQHQTILSENSKTKTMIRNYFLIAWRNLLKQRFYTLINVAGLGIGIAACMIITVFIINELSFDRHHEHAGRIYRLKNETLFNGNHWVMAYMPAPMLNALESDFPEVEAAVHFRERGAYLIKRETENIKEPDVIWASKNVFKVFTIPMLEGNPDNALAEPNTMAISRSLADKLFPGTSALNQTLILDNRWNFKVTGIYEDMPPTSSFNFNAMLAMEGLEEAKSPVWLSNNFQTYALLREGASKEAFEEKLAGLIVTHVVPQAAQILGGDFTMEKFAAAGNKVEYTTQPLLGIHLHSNLLGEHKPTFDITYIYLFGAIALFILVIACINFMNLSTARSANRAREVGIRKVMGSLRSHLVRQFLMESTLLSLFAIVLAIALAYLALPSFNELSGRQLVLPLAQPSFYLILGATTSVIGALAGLYPSFFLSAFRPINVLKGNLALGMKSGFIRSSLVVFQFTVSIILVIGTVVIFRQLNYIQNKKIGFNKDQVLMVEEVHALGDQKEAFRTELLKDSHIRSASFSGFVPVAGGWRNDNSWWLEGLQPTQENLINIQNWRVDFDYIRTLGMNVVQGRDFSPDFPSDSGAVILNQRAAQRFGIEADPIGKTIVTFGGDNLSELSTDNLDKLTVIGIVEDFHFESLKDNIGGLMMLLSHRPEGMLSVRFEAGSATEVLAAAEKIWKEMAPGQPFTYQFMDESFGRMYAAETRLGRVFAFFAGLAVIIACLGLFALTSFTAEQRTKEIGIRKVMGASVGSIVVLLSREFSKLILISIVLSAPVAWYGTQWWLNGYSYKVEIGPMVYVLAGLAAFAIAWITMSFQSIKAAVNNPVQSLRSE